MQILNIAGNNLESLGEIGSLINLVQLIASNNNLNDMKEMSVILKCWPKLSELDLSGNPLCMKNKYRERIIVLAPNIKILDGKEIQDMSRQFLQNWKLSKEMNNSYGNVGLNNQREKSSVTQNEEMNMFLQTNNLASELPARNGIHKINSMPTYIMPGIFIILKFLCQFAFCVKLK